MQRTINVPCRDWETAQNALDRIREIGFPIEEEKVVNFGPFAFAQIRIDMRRTDGIHYPMNQIIGIGLRPEFTS